MEDTIEILVSTDNNYVMPTGVMLTSLFENNKNTNVGVHVMIDMQFSEEGKASLSKIVEKYNGKIMFYTMNDDLFKDFPLGESFQSGHITSMTTYYRLFATDILPLTTQKVIYLDGDIIVRKSLKELWDTNVDDFPIAAVPDSETCSVRHYNRLRYSQTLGYFNAGVLVINLKYWREHNMKDKFCRIAREKHSMLSCHDQDILNYLFRNNKLNLPLKYNMQNCFLYRRDQVPLLWTFDRQIEEGQKDPVIIHFSACPKLWNSDSHHPYKREFQHYRSLTEWRDMREKRHYHGRSLLYWTVVRTAIRLGLSKPSNDPENYYIKPNNSKTTLCKN